MMSASKIMTTDGTKPRPIFVYSTRHALQFLTWALTGNSFNQDNIKHLLQPARFDGVARYGRDNNPAAVICNGSRVDGYLVNFQTMAQRRQLDEHDAQAYTITAVRTRVLGKDGKPLGWVVYAEMFLWGGSLKDLTRQPWDVRDMFEENLEDWLVVLDRIDADIRDEKEGLLRGTKAGLV